MRLSDAHALPSADHSRLARPMLVVITLGLVTAVALLDFRLAPNAPISHLYYIPILLAAVKLGRRWALGFSALAIVLLHLADPALANLHYAEADILQIVLFVCVGWVAAQLADDKRELRRLAATDDLTGLGNLRAFESDFRDIVEDARARQGCAALIVLDVDNLKALNDAHGHLAGADAVKAVGSIIARELPFAGRACRYGGDEFAIVLGHADAFSAEELSDLIRRAVADASPTLDALHYGSGTLSVSAGVARARIESSTVVATIFSKLFREADAAMYRAKRARTGRDRDSGSCASGAARAAQHLIVARTLPVSPISTPSQQVGSAPEAPFSSLRLSQIKTGATRLSAAPKLLRRRTWGWALLGAFLVLTAAGLFAATTMADGLGARLLSRP